MLQHRVVWELANGPIPKGFHVHHINGVRDDNRIENLSLLPAAVHNSQHSRGRPGHRHSEATRRLLSERAKQRKRRTT